VSSDLAKRVVEVELGRRSGFLPVGNLTSRRAILDVRDLVRALWLAAERCEAGEVYNVCANHAYSVGELIEYMSAQSPAVFEVQQDTSLMRGCDEPVIAGDTRKFRDCTGWTQTIELTRTLKETLEWWRSHMTPELLHFTPPGRVPVAYS
jgi:nucleoside-diphosphate-sugar epimerase